MNQKKKTAGAGVNLLFTMLLFLVFVLCALFTVLFGSRVYENISSRSENNDTESVALHYIANKVRQGDRDGAVDVIEIEGTPVLELTQMSGEVSYYTWIYYRDGCIRELFTREGTGLGLDGIWWALTITSVMKGIVFVIYYVWILRRLPHGTQAEAHA